MPDALTEPWRQCWLQRRIKRALDLVGAGTGVVVLSPVIATVALIVRARLGSPVLFRQTRPGLHGEPFELIKFRTMLPETPGLRGPESDGQRLTALGTFLRSWSLDELPTLWNVVRGDMALVGPRPLLMDYLERYSPEQARRHHVPPGVTGWAQINGRNALSWRRKFELDVWYVDHWSLWLDLRILGETLARVLGRQGISAPGQVTMSPFRGDAEKPRP